MRPPPTAPRRVQNPTNPRYTLSASGHLPDQRQTVAATRFSQSPRLDAPISCEKSGLATRLTRVLASSPQRHSRFHGGTGEGALMTALVVPRPIGWISTISASAAVILPESALPDRTRP